MRGTKLWLVGAIAAALMMAACQIPVPTGTDQPATEQPATEQPAAGASATETPAPDAVATQESGVKSPIAEPQATGQPAPEKPAGTPVAGAGIAEADLPGAALNIRQMLAQQLGINPTDVIVIEATATDWSDSCLGAGGPEEMCAAVITPGYLLVMEANGGRYVYHTDTEGNLFRLVEAPEINVGDVIVEFTSTNDAGLCQKTFVGTDGVAYGGCYSELRMSGRLAMEQRSDDLEYFRSTFAPFSATTPTGDVVFNGEGAQEANPTEQRLLGEWMSIVVAEVMSGRTSAGLGLGLAVFQEGGIAALCQNVSVYLSGVAYVADCKAQPPVTLPVVRLDSEQLDQLYSWVDALQSFEDERVDGTADVMTTTVFFAGRGEGAADDETKAAIEGLSAELAARARETADARTSSCPEPGEGQALYRSDVLGYCILYPTTHAPVESSDSGTAFVVGGDIMNHVDPRMDVSVSEATGTAEEAADAMVADASLAMQPEEMPRTNVSLGPVGAVVVDHLPGQDLRRVLFAVHNGKLYTVSFTPADGDIEDLYLLAVESLSFTE